MGTRWRLNQLPRLKSRSTISPSIGATSAKTAVHLLAESISSAGAISTSVASESATTSQKESQRKPQSAWEKMGLPAERIPADSDAPLYDNMLLVTGRMTKIDEGNGFSRVALGLGDGESELATEFTYIES